MTHSINYTLERGDDVFELEIEYTVAPYYPAQTYGPPEHCCQDEGGEIEEMTVRCGIKPFTLTALEEREVEEWIYEHHDYEADDGGGDWWEE